MRIVRAALVVLVCALGLSIVNSEAAPPAKKPPTPKVPKGPANKAKGKDKQKGQHKEDIVLAAEMQHAYNVLSAAEPIYSGHRGKALREIKLAIGHMEKELRARGLKPNTKHTMKVPKVVSHALVRETMDELAVIHTQLSQFKPTGSKKLAAAHLVKAVKELALGLASVKE